MKSMPGSRPAAAWLWMLAAAAPLVYVALFLEPFLAAKELVLVAGAPVAALLWLTGAPAVARTPHWKPLAVVAALCLFAFRPSSRVDTALCLLAALVLFAVAASEMARAADREALGLVVTAVGSLEAVLVLWQAVLGDPLFPSSELPGKWRAFGTFGNPNWAGEFLAMAFLVTLGRLAARWSPAKLAALILIAAGLAATFARGAWVACAAGVVALAVAGRGRIPGKLRAAAGTALAAALAVAGVLALRPDTLRYLVNLESFHGRVWMWLVSARMIVENPLGVGLGGFERHFPDVQARCFATPWGRPFLNHASFTPQAHNDYLQLAAEAGIPALAAAAVLVWMVLRRGRAVSRHGTALGCWAAVVAMLADALFASPFYLPGTLAVIAILYGTAESAVSEIRPVAMPRGVRAAVCAAGLVAVVVAGHWCWRRAMSEAALGRAAMAIPLRSWDKALAALDRALRHDAGRLEAHSMAGRVRLARGEFTAAAASYARAARLGYDVEVFAGQATALWHAERRGDALAVLERLEWLRPDLEWPRRRLAELRRNP